MPFRVRQWPVQPDPRSSFFTFKGWNWGQVPPWQWIMSTEGASGPFAFLNDGIIIVNIVDGAGVALWQGATEDEFPTFCTFIKAGFDEPQGAPPRTIELAVNVAPPAPLETASGILNFVYPDAIQVFGPFTMEFAGEPIEDLPNGIILTPAIWDLETV